jgi:hypothetical protein
MNENAGTCEQGGDGLLAFEVSDEALEAAVVAPAGAMSFPSAPTLSVLVMCCGNNAPTR